MSDKQTKREKYKMKNVDYKNLRRLIVTKQLNPITQDYEDNYYFDLPISTKMEMFIEEFGRKNIRKVYSDIEILSNQGQFSQSGTLNEAALGNTFSVAISIFLRGEIIGGVREPDFPLVENLRATLTGHPMESDGAIANKVRGLALSQALTDLGYRLPEEYTTVTEEDIKLYHSSHATTPKPESKSKSKSKTKIVNPFDEINQKSITKDTLHQPKETVVKEAPVTSHVQETSLFNESNEPAFNREFSNEIPSFVNQPVVEQEMTTNNLELEQALDVKFDIGFFKGETLRTLSQSEEGRKAIESIISNGNKMFRANKPLPEHMLELYNGCIIVQQSWA